LKGKLEVTTEFKTPADPSDKDGISGSLRLGFVEVSTNMAVSGRWLTTV